MAKIGIICDGFKKKKFEEELKAANIPYEIVGKTSDRIITISCTSEQHIVKPIVDKVTQYFIDQAKEKKDG